MSRFKRDMQLFLLSFPFGQIARKQNWELFIFYLFAVGGMEHELFAAGLPREG